ncbi:unnamed protein product, partial [Amoebophrya sp. A25]|eukprot:GSA25T00025455001.1
MTNKRTTSSRTTWCTRSTTSSDVGGRSTSTTDHDPLVRVRKSGCTQKPISSSVRTTSKGRSMTSSKGGRGPSNSSMKMIMVAAALIYCQVYFFLDSFFALSSTFFGRDRPEHKSGHQRNFQLQEPRPLFSSLLVEAATVPAHALRDSGYELKSNKSMSFRNGA